MTVKKPPSESSSGSLAFSGCNTPTSMRWFAPDPRIFPEALLVELKFSAEATGDQTAVKVIVLLIASKSTSV